VWGVVGGWWRGIGGGRAEAMVLHMSRRHTRVRFTWETTPVGWLQTWSSTEYMHFNMAESCGVPRYGERVSRRCVLLDLAGFFLLLVFPLGEGPGVRFTWTPLRSVVLIECPVCAVGSNSFLLALSFPFGEGSTLAVLCVCVCVCVCRNMARHTSKIQGQDIQSRSKGRVYKRGTPSGTIKTMIATTVAPTTTTATATNIPTIITAPTAT